MPIYEFKCKKCGKIFEILFKRYIQETPKCPTCESEEVERLLSTFSVPSVTVNSSSSACISNSSKQCSTCCNAGLCPVTNNK